MIKMVPDTRSWPLTFFELLFLGITVFTLVPYIHSSQLSRGRFARDITPVSTLCNPTCDATHKCIESWEDTEQFIWKMEKRNATSGEWQEDTIRPTLTPIQGNPLFTSDIRIGSCERSAAASISTGKCVCNSKGCDDADLLQLQPYTKCEIANVMKEIRKHSTEILKLSEGDASSISSLPSMDFGSSCDATKEIVLIEIIKSIKRENRIYADETALKDFLVNIKRTTPMQRICNKRRFMKCNSDNKCGCVDATDDNYKVKTAQREFANGGNTKKSWYCYPTEGRCHEDPASENIMPQLPGTEHLIYKHYGRPWVPANIDYSTAEGAYYDPHYYCFYNLCHDFYSNSEICQLRATFSG